MTALLAKWVLTSSLLIGAVIVLRLVFGKRISARLRYALWAAVLVRLLIPVQLLPAPVETPQVFPETGVTAAPSPLWTLPAERRPVMREEAPAPVIPAPGGQTAVSGPSPRRAWDLAAAAGGVWLAGSAAVFLTLLAANGRFAARLRRVRRPLALEGPIAVYLTEGLPSPCLFGAAFPAVYVTPEAAADPAMLRHVLAHEFTHYRHGDHIWSLLRCAALAVHWWNPLVWLAAALSRRDAELACDEGALKRLGDGERRAYGGTLLALVTAKPRPGDLLRCATTMAGGKRSLRERLDRIAHAPKRWLWAAVLTAALAVLVCACSFAKPPEASPDDPKQELEVLPDGPLEREELERFNTEIFNGEGFNIRNQLLFLTAEDYRQIDLYQLFYNGTGKPVEISEAERQAAADAAWNGEDPGVDLVKCTAAGMDEVLREHLGLSLEETEKRGLERFTYLAEYDAYYSFHGDTNYPGETRFLTGERRNGNILLYYQSGFLAQGGGWPVQIGTDGEIIPAEDYAAACVTLEEQAGGGYHFLSNQICGLPAVPTAYPAWEPERIISLDGTAPCGPESVAIQPYSSGAAQFVTSRLIDMPYEAGFWRGADGYTYAGIWPGYANTVASDYFLRFEYMASAEQISVESYTGICGHDGFKVTYPIAMEAYTTAYYFLDEERRLYQMASDTGFFQEIDLDGDGQRELLWSPNGYGDEFLYLLYQREGRLYKAELKSLIHAAWPEAGYISGYGFGEGAARYLSMSVEVPVPNADFTVSAYRTLWFDGEKLRLYKDETPYADHIREGVEAPAAAEESARRFVGEACRNLAEEGFGMDENGEIRRGQMVWDDWRITGLNGPYHEAIGDIRLEIWKLHYETHTSTPERVVLAGGSYLGEDGWGMIGYPGCDYLCFLLDSAGNQTFLCAVMENDCAPGTELFREDLIRALESQGLLPEAPPAA